MQISSAPSSVRHIGSGIPQKRERDKFQSMAFSNQLSSAEDERLSILLEEMGEALQIIGKIKRHGYDSRDPTKTSSPTNRTMLEKELGDVLAAIKLMDVGQDVSLEGIEKRVPVKVAKLRRYHHHQAKIFAQIDENE